MRYKSNPKIIEAVQWNGHNTVELNDFAEGGFNSYELNVDAQDEPVDRWAEVYNESQLSFNSVNIGDYIIKGTQGEFYPCEQEIFKASYTLVEDEDASELGLYEAEDLVK